MPGDDAATGSAPARAALAGNPSDGYGGAVLAVCVADFGATVEVRPAPGAAVVVEPAEAGALVRAAAARHPGRGAALARRRAPGTGLAVRVRTTIPREVGLAGSSAIVVATLRALDTLHGSTITQETLPHLALAAEADLGIAAGLQDRVAQSFGGLTAMRFGLDGTYTARPVDPAGLPPLFLAWAPGGASPSGTYHAALRARWAAGEPRVREVMRELAAAAEAATEAVERGDAGALGAAMDASYACRAALGPLDPRHVALVEAARAAGLSANYAGSGGAIVGVAPDAARVRALAREGIRATFVRPLN